MEKFAVMTSSVSNQVSGFDCKRLYAPTIFNKPKGATRIYLKYFHGNKLDNQMDELIFTLEWYMIKGEGE